MFKAKFLSLLSLTFLVVGCGGGGGSSSADTSAVPINVSIQKIPLVAGVPTTIIFPIHGQHLPYTNVTIDLARTLAAANITVTAAP
jgi:hypothetical protein